MRTVKELTLDARVENISEVTAFIDAELERLDCPLKAQTQIDIAIDELFSNIAFYAYAPNVGLATVRLANDQQSGMVSITFLDHGIPYKRAGFDIDKSNLNRIEKNDKRITR